MLTRDQHSTLKDKIHAFALARCERMAANFGATDPAIAKAKCEAAEQDLNQYTASLAKE